ncbi:MAG TPA: ATP-binding protein [Casimicrobiaceae bacterium]|nr:ATP-binding protein [Casimicrobiaceae bacterium]
MPLLFGNPSSAEPQATELEKFAGLVQSKTPVRRLVRWVARIRASVHTKLLAGFLVVALLFIAMAAVSLQTIVSTTRQAQLLDEAHEQVSWAQQGEQALARQMHYTDLALLSQSESAIGKILRENNRFNDMLAKLESTGVTEQSLLEQIRSSQDEAMGVVADMANAIRDGKLGSITGELLRRQERLDEQISMRVGQLVEAQRTRMTRLRDSVAAANRRSLVLTSIFAVTSVGLALFCGFVISWSFILPVHDAQRFLDQVAAGNFSGRISVPNRDELGTLAERMNHMTQELQRFDKEQRHAADELVRLNDQLAQASKAKSEFLANMSHELRTPMNAILGFTEMLLDGLYGEVPALLKEPLADIQVNGRHLLGLINDVLDLSKIEAGRMELALDEYSVREVIDIVHLSLRSLAAEKGLTFVASVPDDLQTAYGDNRRLTQCLMNLAGNALKFTKKGRVEIGVEQVGDELIYRVVDTGIGIPKEELDNIFTEFRQVDATVTREFGGTGLGLSITKKFVEMHGGRVWVESEVGKGCTFFFAVPLRAKAEVV